VGELALSAKHQNIARLIALGYSMRDIANELDITEGNIQHIKNSPLMQFEVQKYLAIADETAAVQMRRMSRLADKAIDKLDALLSLATDDDMTLLKLQAEHAQQVLSKRGFGDTTTLHSSQGLAHMLSTQELSELKERARNVIDV